MSKTETSIMTSVADASNVIYLPKPKPSIFLGLEMREFPSCEKVYGFISNRMGYKIRKKIYLSIKTSICSTKSIFE
jgi:hypothetical protein